MKCPQCGFENVDSSTHCLNCGARMDGNLICPKCGETISPDFDRCPHCKHKIPHQPLEEPTKELTKKDKIYSVFNKIFLIVIIVLLATTMGMVWGDFVRFYKGGELIKGSSFYFLFKSWGDMFKELEPLSDPFQKGAVYFEYISQFVMVTLNLIITYLFGIIGIVTSAISLKKKGLKECRSYRFLAIVFTSNLIAMMFILSLHGNSVIIKDGAPISAVAYFSGTISAMMIMAAFSTVIRHKNGLRSLTFEKIVFSLNFVLAFGMIVSLSSNYLYTANAAFSFRNGSLFLETLSAASVLKESRDGIALLVSSGMSVIFSTVECISLSVLIIFFSQGFFTEKERSMKFKIPCYAFSVVSFLLSLIEVGIAISASIFATKIFGEQYYMGEMAFVNVALGLLLLGAGVASLAISRIYRKFERLADQTTKK